MTTAHVIMAIAASGVTGFGLGFWVAKRSVQGIKNDLNDIKKDTEVVKAKVKSIKAKVASKSA